MKRHFVVTILLRTNDPECHRGLILYRWYGGASALDPKRRSSFAGERAVLPFRRRTVAKHHKCPFFDAEYKASTLYSNRCSSPAGGRTVLLLRRRTVPEPIHPKPAMALKALFQRCCGDRLPEMTQVPPGSGDSAINSLMIFANILT